MANDIYSDVFVNNLPESINWDSQVQAIGYASDQNASRWWGILPQLLVLCNIPNLPESTLDLLAFQFQVLFYSQTNNITDPVVRLATKRQLIANNFYYHAHLGTAGTVEQIVSTVYGPAIVQEWFLYKGLANHFRILLPSVISSSLTAQMLSLVNVVKRASQAMDGFFVYSSAPINVYVAVGVFTQAWLFLPMPVSHPTINYLIGGISIFATATVQRSSAVMAVATGLAIKASARQLKSGANVVDIRTKATVGLTAKALKSAVALIVLAEKISGVRK
jgi:P2-related tail formation protein